MYTFLKNVNPKKLAVTEIPAVGISLVIAEFLYKFGSFTTECIAFLATWYVMSLVITKLVEAVGKQSISNEGIK